MKANRHAQWPASGPLALLALVLLATTGPAAAQTHRYGDIRITYYPSPRIEALHGYTEYHFVVENSSQNRPHTVRLEAPAHGDEGLQVSRSAEVAPRSTVHLRLYYPHHYTYDRNVGVTIDGKSQDDVIPTDIGPEHTSSYSDGNTPAALFSQECRSYTDVLGAAQTVGSRGVHELPVEQWSANWLAYSSYDAVMLSAREWTTMPDRVRSALRRYAACGGVLVLSGRIDPSPEWRLVGSRDSVDEYALGFGCVLNLRERSEMTARMRDRIRRSAGETYVPFQRRYDTATGHRRLPVVSDIGVPAKGMLLLMLAFVILIGPVNIIVLSMRQRRTWLLWTVPAAAILTCGIVFGYSIGTEGFSGHYRTAALTMLDENTLKASTIGYTGFYSPLTPSEGLRFSNHTELTAHFGQVDSYYSSPYGRLDTARSLRMDWSDGQRLTAGWVQPRIPAYFQFRKGETRRERLNVEREGGRLYVVNGLGAPILNLHVMDADGKIFAASDIPAGARIELTATGESIPEPDRIELREFYRDDWVSAIDRLANPQTLGRLNCLRPGMYLAVLDGSPFVEVGLRNAKPNSCRSVVIGIMKK